MAICLQALNIIIIIATNIIQIMQKFSEQYLRFGQIIRIHGHKCLQQQSEKEQIRGMIAVKGFTDKDAKYITFKSFKDCYFYRKTLFQILPRDKFDKTDNEVQEKKMLKQYDELVHKKMGEFVVFGEDIVFKHVDSHEYLSGSVRCSDGGMGAFKVELSSKLSNDLVFKLYPFRSFEKIGDRIKLESPLRIKNISNRCYISTEKNINEKFNIVTTYSQNFTWLIHLHETHQTLSETDLIRTHDILYLVHTKNEGYLVKQYDKNPCIKLPQKDTGYPFYTSLWQIQILPVPQISPYNEVEDSHKLGTDGTYSLRQLLTSEYLQVSRLSNSFNQDLDSKEITIRSAKGLPNINDYLLNKGLIRIGGAKTLNDIEIDAGEEKIPEEELIYRRQYPYKINEIKLAEIQSEHGFRVMKLDEVSKDQVLFIISTYEVLDDFCFILEKPIEMFEAEIKSRDLENIDITLQKLIAFIKKVDLENIEAEVLPDTKIQFICMDLEICNKLFIILDHIATKILEEIYKKSKGQNDALKQVFNRAYYLVWQIIKDNPITKLYVCEDSLRVILNHAIQLEEDNVHNTLQEILRNNDEVVLKFLGRLDNQLVLRINDVFSLKPPHEKFLNIFSAACVSGGSPIVSNQNLILLHFLKKLDEQSLFKIKYELVPPQTQQDLERPQIKNLYVECFISKSDKSIRRLKDFFKQSGRIDLNQTSNYFIAYLNLLADVCYGKNTAAKNHVEQMLIPEEIVHDMGMQEANEPINLRKPSIIDALVAILQDKDMENVKGNVDLQRATLRLITFAYVESADQNPVLRINRYRNLDIREGETIQTQQKFKKIMTFIKDMLKNFKSFYILPTADKEVFKELSERKYKQIQRLFTILDLLKSTLANGMWKIKQMQNEIIPLLLKILKNSKNDILHGKGEECDTKDKQKLEFGKFKEEVSKPTPSVEMIVRCKALACELIEIIYDFSFNNLVTETVIFYKDLELGKSQNIKSLHKISLDLANLRSDAKKYLLYESDLWKEKIKNILQHQEHEQLSEQVKQSREQVKKLIPYMVQLSIHKDSMLFFRSLKILKRHFYSSTDIKNELLHLSLYDNNNGQFLACFIQSKRRLLNKLEEESLLYDKTIEVNPYIEINDFLVWLSESVKIGAELNREMSFIEFRSIFQHFNEETRINKFHQRLIKNNDIHPLLLKFLALSKQSLQTYTDFAKQVLKYVYRFLTILARNFKEGKKEMMSITNQIKEHAKQQCKAISQKYQERNNLQSPVFFQSLELPPTGNLDNEQLKNARQRDDCEAILFLSELFNDNKDVLYDEVQMELTSVEISEMINETPIKNFYKSHILDFLRSLIYYKDKHIIINQSRILAKLQDSKKSNIFYRFDNKMLNGLKGKLIHNLIEEWQVHNQSLMTLKIPGEAFPLRKNQQANVIIYPELTYFITMMNLLSNLVEGKHSVNIGKCRQVHSYDTLMNILSSSSLCFPMKAHLRNYINELYYSTPIEEDLAIEIIKKQLPLLIQDLNTLIVILSKEAQGRYQILHPIRYRYLESYIYAYVEQIAYSMYYLLNDEMFMFEFKKQLDTNYARYYYYLHYFVFRIYERLRWILNKFYNHKYIRGFLGKITNLMKLGFLEYFKVGALMVFDRSEEKNHDPLDFKSDQPSENKRKALNVERKEALEKRTVKLLHKLVQAEIGNYFIEQRPEKDKNFPLTFFLPYDYDYDEGKKEEKQNSNNAEKDHEKKLAQKLKKMLFSKDQQMKKKDDYHTIKLNKLNVELHSKKSFQIFMAQFIQKQCKNLYQVDNFSQKQYKFLTKFVSFQSYIQAFVEVNTNSPSKISNDLKIFFFMVLMQFILQHNPVSTLKQVELWSMEDYDSFKDKIYESQVFLKNANVAELLVETLKYTEDLRLVLVILQFGISYLLGGNTECQNSILELVKEDKKNQLFIKIQKLISRLGRKISSKIAEITSRVIPRSDEFIVIPIDRYDYYDHSTKTLKRFGMFEQEIDEIEEEALEKQVFGCLFRFFQLLCECNNIEFKNFIRQQKDSDGQKKNASFNILSMTTFEVRRLFKVMDSEASTIILPLTDFLNEVVSLPVKQNQLSLCETTFFEDLCYMSSFFRDQSNLKIRGFDRMQNLERLYELYQKCILVILNILEGADPKLNQSFLHKLDVKFLLHLLEHYFKQLKINKKEDLVHLLQDSPKQTKHMPIQLQNAINVMIVLLKLRSSDNSQAFKKAMKNYIIEHDKGHQMKLEELVEALNNVILKIEVVSPLGKQDVYFPKHPILTNLSGATRNRIMQEVSRSTQREKIKSLLQYREEIEQQIDHNFTVKKQTFLMINASPDNIQNCHNWVMNFSYIIILIWVVTTDVIVEFQQVTFQSTNPLLALGIFVISSLHLFLTITYLILYWKGKFKLASFRHMKQKQSEEEEQKRKNQLNNNKEEVKGGKIASILSYLGGSISESKVIVFIMNDEKFGLILAFLFASGFGTFYSSSFFMFFVLFYFMQNQTLENVFKAITFNLKQLATVGLLGIVFVYVFCLIFYDIYALTIRAEQSDEDACDTIYMCILDLYVSGTIGGSVEELEFGRFTTDMIYYIFFELLFGNIVSGIMIDTFAERRAARQQMNNDKKNKCYICGKERAQLEFFDDHIEQNHFLWNYIYYLYCLNNKNQTQYTGLQYFVKVCIDSGQNDEKYIVWIPFDSQGDENSGKVTELNLKMEHINVESKNKITNLQKNAKTEEGQENEK